MSIVQSSFDLDDQKKFKIVIIGDAAAGKTCLLTRYLEDIFLENSRPTPGVNVKKKEEVITINEKEGKQSGRHYSRQFEYWDLGGQRLFEQLRGMYMKGADGIILCFSLNDERSFISTAETASEVETQPETITRAAPTFKNRVKESQESEVRDKTASKSDHSIGKFLQEMISTFGASDVKEIPLLLVGCKSDLDMKVNERHITTVVRKLREAGMNLVSYEKNESTIEIFAKHHLKFNRMWEAEKWRTGPGWVETSSKLGSGVSDVFEIVKKVLFERSTFQSEEIMRRAVPRVKISGVRIMTDKSHNHAVNRRYGKPGLTNQAKDDEKDSDSKNDSKPRMKRDLERVW
ncbi:MAG: Rab family GTPase [Candidatus Odinarchaeota archaeon]